MRKVFLTLALGFWACTASAQSPGVQVTEMHAQSGTPMGEITGLARNETDHSIPLVTLSFNLLDANGTQVGNAIAQTMNLAAGGRWQFKADTTTPYATFQLAKVIVQ